MSRKKETLRQVFVDSNLYLNFYRLLEPEFQSLLKPLASVSDSIFITSQIVDEVTRNRLGTFVERAEKLRGSIPSDLGLPSFHWGDKSKASDWVARIGEFNLKLKQIRIEYDESIKVTAGKILDGSDEISTTLERIFSTAKGPTQAQMERARSRKERGNPPGKRSDPLGDQINWEQFIDQARKDESVWIVSTDGDFFDDVRDQTKLNPFLYDELRKRIGTKAQIHCYKELSAALRSFQFAGGPKVVDLPSNEALVEIEKTEATANAALANTLAIGSGALGIYVSPPGFPTSRVINLGNSSAVYIPAQMSGLFQDTTHTSSLSIGMCSDCGSTNWETVGQELRCKRCGKKREA